MARLLVTPRLDLTQLVMTQAGSFDLPPWLRVGLWGWGAANEHGHARAYPGQLRRELGIATADEVSRAVRLARARGLVDACSTSGCLVLPGHALNPCDATHRDAS